MQELVRRVGRLWTGRGIRRPAGTRAEIRLDAPPAAVCEGVEQCTRGAVPLAMSVASAVFLGRLDGGLGRVVVVQPTCRMVTIWPVHWVVSVISMGMAVAGAWMR
jgi:hypothetical protein